MGKIPDWGDISYLACGNARQRRAFRALQELDICNVLSEYTPVLAGTIPLGTDIEESDLDIICQAHDLAVFQHAVEDAYGAQEDFRIERMTVKDVPTVIASFAFGGFPIEVFAQPRPVVEQNAYRHLLVEASLLEIGGKNARRAIWQFRRAGLKTEPAFARYFKIEGDPYEVLLQWSSLSEQELRKYVQDAD